MPLLVDGPVDRDPTRPRGRAWDHGQGAACLDRITEVVGIIARIGDRVGAGQIVDEQVGLGEVVRLPRCQREPGRIAEPVDDQVDLGRQAAARAADGLRLGPPLPPAACRCARAMVLSMITYAKSGSSAIAAKIRRQTPRRLQRQKRV
jgi:hypothetical protein